MCRAAEQGWKYILVVATNLVQEQFCLSVLLLCQKLPCAAPVAQAAAYGVVTAGVAAEAAAAAEDSARSLPDLCFAACLQT